MTPLLGIGAGLALLLAGVCLPDLSFLALAGLVVLVPSLLFGTR